MFTGIIEDMAELVALRNEGTNKHFSLRSALTSELKIDQSVAHNGVCLTVVALDGDVYTVTAVEETLLRTNLGTWKEGQQINIERAMRYNGRLDGHLVQGHVDDMARVEKIEDVDGSWNFSFRFDEKYAALLVDKGSICINGVSLTLIKPRKELFSVTIIPYTYEHTCFKDLRVGDAVNIEFDILGKYIARHAELYAERSVV